MTTCVVIGIFSHKEEHFLSKLSVSGCTNQHKRNLNNVSNVLPGISQMLKKLNNENKDSCMHVHSVKRG